MRTIPAGVFKAKCLAIMDEVNATGEPVVVTKRGKPVVRIGAAGESGERESPESIFGCLSGMIKETADLGNLVDPIIPPEEWECLKDDWSLFPSE
jgi:prevent-host-death family protein